MVGLLFAHGLRNCWSDNSESDEQRKQSESHIQSSPPAPGLAHPGITTPNVQYPMPPQLAGHAVVISLR